MVSALLGLCWRPNLRQALPLVTENSFMLREASSRGFNRVGLYVVLMHARVEVIGLENGFYSDRAF